MAFNPDYGTTAANYTPDVLYTGIGKFARELIGSERINSRFSSLFKEPFKNGKDLEVKVYKKATGVDYSATDAPAAPYPAAEVLPEKSVEIIGHSVKALCAVAQNRLG